VVVLRFANLVRATARAGLSFLFPDTCLACGTPLAESERHLCDRCTTEVTARPGALQLASGEAVASICYALPFDGPARELMRALKYCGRQSAAVPLAGVALELVRELSDRGFDALVPVPLHAARRRERGFNQSELLARRLTDLAGVETLDGLRRSRPTKAQVGLSGPARLRNVAGAFQGRPLIAGRKVILLDDVVTTGATLLECGSAAISAGARDVAGLAVAGPSEAAGEGKTG
jgi:ComF family protein